MSDTVHGLKHFTDYFSEENEQFVIIGGVATNYFLLENDLKLFINHPKIKSVDIGTLSGRE